MVAKPKRRLASGEVDLNTSPSSKLASPREQRKQPKRRTLHSQLHSSSPPSPQALIDDPEEQEEEHHQQEPQPNSSSPSHNQSISDQRPSLTTHQQAQEENDKDQEEEHQKTIKEQEARERIFDEFKDEYFDIIDQIPLDLNRKFSCITELEASLEECKRELHEDLIAYTNFAKEMASAAGPESTIAGTAVEVDNEITNRLRTLAQPMLWGVVPIPPINADTTSGLPEHLKSLLSEISGKIIRLQELSHDKLNLAESVYVSLDRQLKRLDADLETYQDLEDQDAQVERRHHEALNDQSDGHDQSNQPSQQEQPQLTPTSTRLNQQPHVGEQAQELTLEPSGSFNSADDQTLYCSCQRVTFGDMVACDNPDCQGGQWFHLECVGLSQLPTEDNQAEWFCDQCRSQSSTASASHSGKKKKKKIGRRY
ncbi:uncharacterized protein PGTG_11257 [Puccinia graminis f. sp. tritici CRL 75-36-700-3]|uniref:Chromatin modification-related protein n=2 Tax=Puccinia graminis f. sp. tritici TaxID=56615 RepID=E3KLB3_PUCGT|nr:uncharacterized protein PGTG_11257 [Puccinia graminis f. sp. tritici CRL 75-36-700-3]EFP85088.2 hypothetical protein PGTG_11257 [Puccinia graminis f. sp. tritici CRL 75-36-700-3]